MNEEKIFKYLKGTKNYRIKLSGDSTLKGYTDADYGGDAITRKSTSGFLITLGNLPTSWQSKLQHCVATFTAKAEYRLWCMNVMKELGINNQFISIYVENKAAIYNCQNQSINPESKRIDIKYHHIRDLIKENKVKLEFIKSERNIANGFTKYLNGTKLRKFRESLLKEFIPDHNNYNKSNIHQ